MRSAYIVVGVFVVGVAHADPPHRDAFAKEWAAAHACLVGAPAWSADYTRAHGVQRALGVRDCRAEIDRARAIAIEGDADPGYHAQWFDLERALVQLRHADGPKALELVIKRAAAIGVATDATVATISMVSNPPILVDTDRASDVGAAPPVDHQLKITFTRDGDDWERVTAGPDPAREPDRGATTWTSPIDDAISTFGEGNNRTIVTRDVRLDVSIVRSRDGGKTWDKPVAINKGSYQADSAKRMSSATVDVLWHLRPKGNPLYWQKIEGTAPLAEPRKLALGVLRDFCATKSALWWVESSTNRIGVTDAKGTRAIGWSDAHIGPCTDDRIVIVSSDGMHRCDRNRCDKMVRVDGAVADLDGSGELVYAIPIDDLLVVYDGHGAKPRVVRIDGTVVGGAAFYGGPLQVVVAHAGGISLVKP